MIPQYYCPTQSDERIWVQDENQANAYLVAPNSFVRLWDVRGGTFYEKKTDAMGRPYPMEIYEYRRKIMDNTEIPNLPKDFTEDINKILARLDALENKKKKEAKNEQ